MDLHTNRNDDSICLIIQEDLTEDEIEETRTISDDDTICLVIQKDLTEDGIEETQTISDVEDEGVGEEVHSCPECEFKGKSSKELIRHQDIMHSDKPYNCPSCIFVTSSISTLKEHIKSSHLKDPQKCNKCDFQSNDASDYNQHMLMDHKDGENYPCSKCSHKAGTYAKLKRHERTTHPAGYSPTDCSYCLYVAKKPYLLKKHILELHSNKPHICRHCSFSTREFKKLEAHVISNHTNENPFVCPHCMYSADSFAKLKHHYKICKNMKFLI